MSKPLIEITRYPHDAEHKRELFGLIGEFCVSLKVRNELGGPISSDENHVWFVATAPDRSVVGFVSVIPQKGGKAKLAHLYLPVIAAWSGGIEIRLIKACEQEALKMGAKELHTVDYARREKFYHIHGWRKGAQRGQFITYTKSLKP
jgi:hypothetical protein